MNYENLYHVSTRFFRYPDPAFAKVGEGNSSAGLGFYTSSDLKQIDYYLDTMKDQGDKGKIRYKVDLLPTATVLDAYQPLTTEILERARGIAGQSKMPAFKTMLNRLQSASDINAFEFENIIDSSFPLQYATERIGSDQRKTNIFMRSLGIDAIKRIDDVRIINYNAIDKFSIDAILKGGPSNIPEGIGEGNILYDSINEKPHIDFIEKTYQREADYLFNGTIYSEHLHAAVRGIATHPKLVDQEIQNRFQHILDELHLGRQTQIMSNNGGYDARDKIGIALTKAMQGKWHDDFGTRPDNLSQSLSSINLDSQNQQLFRCVLNFFENDLKIFDPAPSASKPNGVGSLGQSVAHLRY